MKTEELKACPFCGGTTNLEIIESNYPGEKQVVCNFNKGGCGASACFTDGDVEAVQKWNRREAQRWIPVCERLPEVNAQGESESVQFCVYWKSTNIMAVFDAIYLHEKEMQCTHTDKYKKWTGWHTYSFREGADYEEIYEPIILSEGDYIVGWQPFAAAPALPDEVPQ